MCLLIFLHVYFSASGRWSDSLDSLCGIAFKLDFCPFSFNKEDLSDCLLVSSERSSCFNLVTEQSLRTVSEYTELPFMT